MRRRTTFILAASAVATALLAAVIYLAAPGHFEMQVREHYAARRVRVLYELDQQLKDAAATEIDVPSAIHDRAKAMRLLDQDEQRAIPQARSVDRAARLAHWRSRGKGLLAALH
jgi:hypothetical protein